MDKKIDVTIKKVSSNEPNVSKRHTSYDIYHNGKYHTTFNDINDAMDHKEKMHKEDMDLDETVLSLQQRQKRALIMRRNEKKIARAREISKKRLAPESNIRKRAFAKARQIVRKRIAGERGAEYEKLGPSEKMAIDRAVEGKQKLINKLALRLIPSVKQAESKRLASYLHGRSLENHGQPEGKSLAKESLNTLFAESFPPAADTSSVIGARAANPVATSGGTKKMPPQGKSKNSNITQYNKFQEEIEHDTPAFTSLYNKSEKSGIDLETLGEVYNRGWNTWTEDCKVNQQQYAFARVNSYINQGKTYFNEDADLHKEEITLITKADGRPVLNCGCEKDPCVTYGMPQEAIAEHEGLNRDERIAAHRRLKHQHATNGDTRLTKMYDRKVKADLDEGGLWANIHAKRRRIKAGSGGRMRKPGTEGAPTDQDFKDAQESVNEGLWANINAKRKRIKSGSGERMKPPGTIPARVFKDASGTGPMKEGIGSADPDYHAKVHQDLQWHAGRNRGNSMGAANYHHLMTLDDPSHIETYYEKTVYPILKKHNYPTPPAGPGDGGNPKYHAAVQEIIKNWKNEPRWMHNEETELDEKRGLWSHIHAKRKRIKSGSGERMRKPGSEGAPTKQNFKDASESIEEGYDVNSKHYKALTDLDLNTKNRDMTTKHDGYGPLNPSDTKGSKAFWDEKAKMWNTTTEAAMEARCRNCAAFNQAPAIMKKMAEGLGPAGEKIQELSNLGFCELFEFKCAGDRTCNKWLVNGPITEEDTGNGTRLVDKESKNSKARKSIENVDRSEPREHGKQTQIMRKVIENHDNCGTPECCGQCDTAVTEKIGNGQNNPAKRLLGTNSLAKAYKNDTPGEGKNLDEAFNIAFASGVGVTLTAKDLGGAAQSSFAHHPSVVEEMNRRAQEEVDEEVRSGDIKGEVVPAHMTTVTDAKTGATKQVTVPATVRRGKANRKIIGSGNLTDGEPSNKEY